MSVMQSFIANQRCDPFSSRSTPCQLGNYVQYAVNVSSAADVQATVRFARTNNIRLVVRNTGHEYVHLHIYPGPRRPTSSLPRH
jgi:FAD/FMN-containing dehydrogenase